MHPTQALVLLKMCVSFKALKGNYYNFYHIYTNFYKKKIYINFFNNIKQFYMHTFSLTFTLFSSIPLIRNTDLKMMT